MEEKIAQNVAAVAYIGLWSCIWSLSRGWPSNYFMSFPSGGVDTVSERNKSVMNKFINASLDIISCPVSIPCHGIISGGPEKSTSRNRCCGGRTSAPRLWRSSFSAIYQCYCQWIDAMACSISPLCVFVTIFFIGSILTDQEAIPHMATNDDEYNDYYIPKGTVVFGSAWSVWSITGLYFCLDCLCVGPYCMTPKFLTTPWSTSPSGIWRMESSIQIWWTATLLRLVTDAGENIQHILWYTNHWASS